MTRTEILSIHDAPAAREAVDTAYTAGNHAGRGYAVGDEGDGIHDLSAELGERLAWSAPDLAVYDDGRRIVAVGDANGPWAVVVAQ